MDHSPSPTSAAYAVSRSRGKQPGESLYHTKLREMRKAKGQAKSSDESESEDEIEPGKFVQGSDRLFCSLMGYLIGAVVLHKMFKRKVVLHPDSTVVKSGQRIAIGEAEALRVAAQAGIPAHVSTMCTSLPMAKAIYTWTTSKDKPLISCGPTCQPNRGET